MYSCFAFPCLASSCPAGSTKGSTLVRSPDLIFIRVLPPGLFLQDGTRDLGEQRTAGDRWEPFGSDGMWTKRGPGPAVEPTRRSASVQRRSGELVSHHGMVACTW